MVHFTMEHYQDVKKGGIIKSLNGTKKGHLGSKLLTMAGESHRGHVYQIRKIIIRNE